MKKYKISEQSLTLPLDVESEQWARNCDGLLKAGCIFIVILITLAGFGSVSELSIASGELATQGAPIKIEHPEGGAVAEIFVRPGQVVEEGQPIIRLAPLAAESELAQIEIRHVHLMLQRERLRALNGGRPSDFNIIGANFPDLAEDQRLLYSVEFSAIAARKNAAIAVLHEREAEQLAAEHEVASDRAQVKISDELLQMQSGLHDKGHASLKTLLETRAQLETRRTELAETEQSLASAKRAIAEAKSQRAREIAEQTEAWSAEIAEISGEIAQLEETLVQQLDRVERLLVRSSVRGIVHELLPQTRGEVLAPGDQIATIVPLDVDLEAEVKIDPIDIGHIQVGDFAEIAVTSFDEELFGTLIGTVASISPTTFPSDDGPPFYRARLSLDRNILVHGTFEAALLPGMIVRAEIRTGEKSLLRYMFKPVSRALDRAFTER